MFLEIRGSGGCEGQFRLGSGGDWGEIVQKGKSSQNGYKGLEGFLVLPRCLDKKIWDCGCLQIGIVVASKLGLWLPPNWDCGCLQIGIVVASKLGLWLPPNWDCGCLQIGIFENSLRANYREIFESVRGRKLVNR